MKYFLKITELLYFYTKPLFCYKHRKNEINNLPFISHAISEQQMLQLPNHQAYIWDEIHGLQGPPGWDRQLFWDWEDVRLLLTFVPARMKSDQMRSVVIMYRPVSGPPPSNNNMGFRSPVMARIKVKSVVYILA